MPARLLLRRLVDLVVGGERRPAGLRQYLRDRRRQRRLAVIDMPDRPDIAMRLRPTKLRLRHRCGILWLKRTTKSSALAAVRAAGAGDGNRTHIASLEGWSSTIELHPHSPPPTPADRPSLPDRDGTSRGGGGGGRIRTYVGIRRQIYSLLPLTTRPPLQTVKSSSLSRSWWLRVALPGHTLVIVFGAVIALVTQIVQRRRRPPDRAAPYRPPATGRKSTLPAGRSLAHAVAYRTDTAAMGRALTKPAGEPVRSRLSQKRRRPAMPRFRSAPARAHRATPRRCRLRERAPVRWRARSSRAMAGRVVRRRRAFPRSRAP